MSETTVKSLAKKYGVSARDIIRELSDQGFDDITAVDDVIDASIMELVEAHFDELYDTDEPVMPKNSRKGGKNKPGKGGQQEKNFSKAPEQKKSASGSPVSGTVTLPSPVIVKDLAEALGKSPMRSSPN